MLSKDCEYYLGKNIFVFPLPGFGWQRIDEKAPHFESWHAAGPSCFFFKVDSSVIYENSLIGFKGIVSSSGHKYSFSNCIVLTRNGDEVADLRHNIAHYNIVISRGDLQVTPNRDIALYNWFEWDLTKTTLFGYGMVAESEHNIKDLQRMQDSRETYIPKGQDL